MDFSILEFVVLEHTSGIASVQTLKPFWFQSQHSVLHFYTLNLYKVCSVPADVLLQNCCISVLTEVCICFGQKFAWWANTSENCCMFAVLIVFIYANSCFPDVLSLLCLCVSAYAWGMWYIQEHCIYWLFAAACQEITCHISVQTVPEIPNKFGKWNTAWTELEWKTCIGKCRYVAALYVQISISGKGPHMVFVPSHLHIFMTTLLTYGVSDDFKNGTYGRCTQACRSHASDGLHLCLILIVSANFGDMHDH